MFLKEDAQFQKMTRIKCGLDENGHQGIWAKKCTAPCDGKVMHGHVLCYKEAYLVATRNDNGFR